jgi:hypothetical protein
VENRIKAYGIQIDHFIGVASIGKAAAKTFQHRMAE